MLAHDTFGTFMEKYIRYMIYDFLHQQSQNKSRVCEWDSETI